jgi:hypothetical protein
VRLPVIPSPVSIFGGGMMGFAVLLAGGVNQVGSTTPVPFSPDAGDGEWGS